MPTSLKSVVKSVLLKGAKNQPKPVRDAASNLLNELKIAREVRNSSRQFRQLKGQKNLKIHLGCGGELKPGWVNVDLNLHGNVSAITADAPPGTMFINYDLRLGALPLDDESCALIYSSHFFEHLEYGHGLQLMRDCHRMLQAGGTFRAALPDFKGMFRAYLAGDREHLELVNISEVLPEVEPGTESLVDHVNYGVYQSGEHKCIYDEEKICLVLRSIGFGRVEIVPYKEDLDPANELRRRYSFYVEALK